MKIEKERLEMKLHVHLDFALIKKWVFFFKLNAIKIKINLQIIVQWKCITKLTVIGHSGWRILFVTNFKTIIFLKYLLNSSVTNSTEFIMTGDEIIINLQKYNFFFRISIEFVIPNDEFDQLIYTHTLV